MDFSSARSERLIAIVSTLVAVAILAGGVTAYQSHHAPVEDVVQLESDLRFQLEVAFQHDPNERARRLALLGEVSQAWTQSPRLPADHQELASWLLEATIRSMPGSIEALPAVPHFGEQNLPAVDERATEVLVLPAVGEGDFHETLELSAQGPTSVSLPAPFASAAAPPTIANSFEVLATPQPTAQPTTQPKKLLAEVVEIRINLTELAARIAGYHAGLDEVETALLSLDAEDFKALRKQVRQLEEMASDFRFARLYYEVLTDQERRAVDAPRPMTTMLAAIGRQLDRSQESVSGDYLEEFDASNQDRIGSLRQQLAEITAKTR